MGDLPIESLIKYHFKDIHKHEEKNMWDSRRHNGIYGA